MVLPAFLVNGSDDPKQQFQVYSSEGPFCFTLYFHSVEYERGVAGIHKAGASSVETNTRAFGSAGVPEQSAVTEHFQRHAQRVEIQPRPQD